MKRFILIELLVVALSLFDSSRVSAQALEPPLPQGSTYYKGMVVSQLGMGVIGCAHNQVPAADGNGCITVGTNGPFVSLVDTALQSMDGPLNNPKLNGVITVEGNKYPRTDAGIQSAINDAVASSSSVYLTAGTYTLGPNLPIKITGYVGLFGAGRTATILSVASSVTNVTDVFWIQPQIGATIGGIEFSSFAVFPASGTPARYGFNFDGSLGQVFNVRMNNVYVGGFNGQAIFCDGTGLGQGNLGISEIGPGNFINGGILCNLAGDTLKIDHNLISGANVGIDVNNTSGSSTLLISDNNIQTPNGAIHLGANVTGALIFNNEMEIGVGATGSNDAIVDLDGTAIGNITGTVLFGNKYQASAATNVSNLRINYAANTDVHGEYFIRAGGSSFDVIPTANANHTVIGQNTFASGGPLSSNIDGSGTIGTDTKFAFFDNSGNFYVYGANITDFKGLNVNGSQSGYTGGEVMLGGTVPSSFNAISTNAANSSPTITFDHRGANNSGNWSWRNGTGAGNTRMSLDANGNLFMNTVNVDSSRQGTFVCTGGGTITVNNANILQLSKVVISLNTAGGTVTTPIMKTNTPTVSFTVLCGASDTSTYNYAILD